MSFLKNYEFSVEYKIWKNFLNYLKKLIEEIFLKIIQIENHCYTEHYLHSSILLLNIKNYIFIGI